MRTTPSRDLRVTKTLEAIDTSFRTMMLQSGFEAITVKALCERARVNKKTFYRYYETLEDLLAEVMATYAAAWRRRTSHLRMPQDVDEVTRELFRFGAEQDELYDAITRDPSSTTCNVSSRTTRVASMRKPCPTAFRPSYGICITHTRAPRLLPCTAPGWQTAR